MAFGPVKQPTLIPRISALLLARPFRNRIPWFFLLVLSLICGCDATPEAPGGTHSGMRSAKGPESTDSFPDPSLSFDADGRFTIVHFTDTQDDQDIDPRTVHLMEAVLAEVGPDLVVFTGDNVRSGPETPEDVRTAIDAIAGPVEAAGVPWFITFGNHDEDHTPRTGMDEAALLEYYMGFPHNINQQDDADVTGTGNMVVMVSGSESPEPALALWGLDSGRYVPDSVGAQSVSADGLRTYDWIRPSQVDWYVRSSFEMEARFGASVPGLMFFHIPLPEFDLMWENRENHGVVGEKNEDVAAGAFNGGLFGAVQDRGDVVGIFVGHDHVNDFVGNYFGVWLGYSANTGYGTYGLDGHDPDRMRGARVLIVHEDDPRNLETRMIFARDLGIG